MLQNVKENNNAIERLIITNLICEAQKDVKLLKCVKVKI